ncbi:MAG: histidinol-phosphatase [Planctomycetes bacterium]|nr:histidinol-phosphatase [Planctomycetota bacterium]
MKVRSAWTLVAALAVASCNMKSSEPAPREGLMWLKGNTHSHTIWSDGNAPPEQVVDWYDERSYDFLSLSEHNIVADHERWFPIKDDSRLMPSDIDALTERFGTDWVKIRPRDGFTEMKLKTLGELRERLRIDRSRLMLLTSEELTDSYEGKPVHVNGINLKDVIPPQGGRSVLETIENNMGAVEAHGLANKRAVLSQLNHPNFGWAVRPDDLALVSKSRFFEVYNGHAGTLNYGDDTHSGMEAMWDMALASRVIDNGLGMLFGVATDDSHDYRDFGIGKHNPGRGWVMVQAEERSAEAIIRAMNLGRFYSSTGVSLKDVQFDGQTMWVWIDDEPGVRYTTRFVGTRRTRKGSMQPSEIFLSTEANPAVFTFAGDELYVRAKITSDRQHPNPYKAGDKEAAWVQPVRGPSGR